jgi:transcription elongation GreA/GreB family factor
VVEPGAGIDGTALNGCGVGQVVEVNTPKGPRRLRITAVS